MTETAIASLLSALFPYLGWGAIVVVLLIMAARAVWPFVKAYFEERLRQQREQSEAFKKIAESNLLMCHMVTEVRNDIGDVREDISAIYEAVKLERPKRLARPGKVGA